MTTTGITHVVDNQNFKLPKYYRKKEGKSKSQTRVGIWLDAKLKLSDKKSQLQEPITIA